MNMKINRYGLAAACAGLFLSGAAHAVAIEAGSEQSLESLFNDVWITSGSHLYVNGSEQVTNAAWEIGSSTLAASGIVIELAGNANYNSFGIYDLTNPSNDLELFSGANTAGTHTMLQYLGSNQFSIYGSGSSVTFGSASFGFYLNAGAPTVNTTFYSDASLNPGGYDQMVAFQGDGSRLANFFGVGSFQWMSNEWVLAWEDLGYGSSDKDFNDFVVSVESVTPTPVPEPATLALLGTGLLVSTVVSRRRKKGGEPT